MVNRFTWNLHTPLSKVRLERYRPKDAFGQPFGSDLDMLTNYFWNIALCEAIYPSLNTIEVALRNTIHSTLTYQYHTDEWWHEPRLLLPAQYDTIADMEQDYLAKNQIAITPGRVISQLSFSFWTKILSHPYESRIWRYRRFVLLRQAFPHSTNLLREDIFLRFNATRMLRNRVMHYEAIYDRPALATEHAEIHGAIQWISPELHQGLHAVDSFPDILVNGHSRVYDKLHRMLGGP